mmetsp:Transcript_6776/g.23672  ORF Transcript_6776/g.23672 Transcript_6776/m.23672 type:complete len:201 (-) Transcript_6776:958-1560(-)
MHHGSPSSGKSGRHRQEAPTAALFVHLHMSTWEDRLTAWCGRSAAAANGRTRRRPAHSLRAPRERCRAATTTESCILLPPSTPRESSSFAWPGAAAWLPWIQTAWPSWTLSCPRCGPQAGSPPRPSPTASYTPPLAMGRSTRWECAPTAARTAAAGAATSGSGSGCSPGTTGITPLSAASWSSTAGSTRPQQWTGSRSGP